MAEKDGPEPLLPISSISMGTLETPSARFTPMDAPLHTPASTPACATQTGVDDSSLALASFHLMVVRPRGDDTAEIQGEDGFGLKI